MRKEIKRITNIEGHFNEVVYLFKNKPNFSTLGFIMEYSRQEPLICFIPDDSIRALLDSIASTICEEYNVSDNPVGILSFDIIFNETDIAEGMIFQGIRSGIVDNFTMDVDTG